MKFLLAISGAYRCNGTLIQAYRLVVPRHSPRTEVVFVRRTAVGMCANVQLVDLQLHHFDTQGTNKSKACRVSAAVDAHYADAEGFRAFMGTQSV